MKDLTSKWEPSDRSGKWLKLKPEYVRAGSDLDVLIIGLYCLWKVSVSAFCAKYSLQANFTLSTGGYYGSGRHGGEVEDSTFYITYLFVHLFVYIFMS